MSNIVYPVLPGLGYSVVKSPNFKTRIQRAVSGRTLRSGDWVNPIWSFTLTYEWLDDGGSWGSGGAVTDLRTLMNFFITRFGSFDDFLLLDPTDNDITGAVLARNPADATMTQFQLVRQLAPGGLSEWVTAPNQVRAVYLDGQPATQFTLDLDTGIITFPSPIGAQVVTADFSYYFRVYFPDTLDFENFAEAFWRLKQVKLTSVALSTAPALCFLGPTPSGGNVIPAIGGSTPPASGGGSSPPPTRQPPPPTVTTTITIFPSAPVISSAATLGSTVATIGVHNSDGSPFAGRLFFVAPHFDSGGVFALSGNTIIVNPAGPGVGNITGSVTDHVTVDATP